MTMMDTSSPRPPSAPSKPSEALRLRSLGLSNKQVAAVLNVPVPSARRLVSEAKRDRAPLNGMPLISTEPWVYCPKHRRARATLDGDCLECCGLVPEGPTGFPGLNKALFFSKLDEAISALKKPTHLVIPDTQCKPGVPLDHLLWAGKYIAERKPDVVVHLGDHWDLPSLSSYEGKGSKYFEGKRLREDIAAGNRGLDLLMEGMGDYRPARMVLLRGNHEDRLARAINESPTLLDGLVGFADFNDVAHGWEVVDYLVPITIDGITYSHYFYHPNTGRAYSGSVDNMLRNIGHSFTMGHQQGKRMGSRELGNGATQRGLVVGSFYQHDEDYKGPQGNSHWRGMVVCHEVGEGTYDLMEVSMDFLRRRFS